MITSPILKPNATRAKYGCTGFSIANREKTNPITATIAKKSIETDNRYWNALAEINLKVLEISSTSTSRSFRIKLLKTNASTVERYNHPQILAIFLVFNLTLLWGTVILFSSDHKAGYGNNTQCEE